ncbi:GntR family transcriptional regulator [Nocardia cyriacigeorgica]|uniref:GntR family transcriptional regulator n=1 Tax=Nocardia cyriacigeorgica TaxID=135487 RepID=UPI00066219C4|nr:GntR family transcriptional regulator [Nocardia cyriacigeorgica]
MSETDAPLPKYLRIAEDIRGRIERGELGVGDEVESERELAVRWSVARPTAAKALNTLRQSGIVESRRGAGTFVARRAPAVRDGNAPGWVRGGSLGDFMHGERSSGWVRESERDQTMHGDRSSGWVRASGRGESMGGDRWSGWASSGGTEVRGSIPLSSTPLDETAGAEAGDRRVRTVVIAAKVTELPETVAEIFGGAGDGIVRRVVIDSEGDVRLRTTWYPHEFAPTATRLLEPSPIPGGANRYLQSVLGATVARVHERVCARSVAEDERVHLGLEPGAPVLVRQTVRYDPAGGVLSFAETVHPPGHWVA